MWRYHISDVCILICIGQMVLTTNALIFARKKKPTVCFDNTGSDAFIDGDSHNAVQNFMNVISNREVFRLTGDVITGVCRRSIEGNKRRRGRYYNDVSWTMDCWEPSECTMIEQYQDEFYLFYLLSTSTSTNAADRVRSVFLPLDSHESATYTFLPSFTDKNIFFITAMLTGCSFFVAKPNDINCNLIVIHTNYRCDDRSPTGTDYNHHQAMAVIEEVEQSSHLCRYRIERRWADSEWRPVVEAAGYDYANKIFYYELELHPFFLYASYVSRNSRRWQFCIKVAQPSPPPPVCYFI